MLGSFASGITVITTMSGDEPVGMTCQSFSSVSLDPPLITFIPARTSRAWPLIQRSGRFCVNVLAADQEHVSAQMATKGADKFAGLDWQPGPFGSPVIERSSAQMEVEIRERLQASTHTVIIGRVVHAAVSDRAPMIYSAGRFYDAGALSPLG